jgi:hypothetical protein
MLSAPESQYRTAMGVFIVPEPIFEISASSPLRDAYEGLKSISGKPWLSRSIERPAL